MNEIIMDNRIYNYIVHNSDINKDENKVIEFGIEMIKMLSVAAIVAILIAMITVSYTHLTLPTNSRV